MEITADNIKQLIEIGRTQGTPFTVAGGDPFVILPQNYRTEDISKFLAPTRIQQLPQLIEAGSFIDYVNRFKTGDTMIFANVTDTGATLVAMLDYHGPAPKLKPAYCQHKATFQTLPTKEWSDWMAANGKRMDQVAFATWLEENYPLITEPSGAVLLELVQTLIGKSDVRYNSAIRLKSGSSKLDFEEDVTLRGTTATKEGEVELPQIITAGIAPFQGTDKYEVKARLKYRIESRKLQLWFETIAQHRIVRDAILGIVKQVAEKTEIIPLIGRP